MWREYSSNYIRNNRASSISIIAAALISALFLSFLCSLFYNFWLYDVESIVLKEGDWQGRITGKLDENDLLLIKNFGSIEHAIINKELSEKSETVVDLYFHNPRTIFQDMPLLIRQLELEEQAASFHIPLLSLYLIHDPQDESPPLLMAVYLVILVTVSLSLVLIIRNSFAVSMNARIHQFGIFSSIGASPRQIRICLMQEAFALCTVPILAGAFLGAALSAGACYGMEQIAAGMPGRHELVFRYHPMIFAITILSSCLTVLFSAWMPAAKLSRLTPLQALRGPEETQGDKRFFLMKTRKSHRLHILSLMFGIEGELAGNALRAQKKALRTSTLSLTLSFLGFTLLLCFFTLSDISTRHTYFERYQNAWDVMVTLKDTKIEDFRLAEKLDKSLNKASKGTADKPEFLLYQKAEALCLIDKEDISNDLMSLGGPGAVTGASFSWKDGPWPAKAPVIILTDEGFTKYCRQIGAEPRLDGTIIFNRFWDSLNSNFRYPVYIPYVKEQKETVLLQSKEEKGSTLELPVVAYTQSVPVLREEYAGDELAQFIPLSLWKKISKQLGGAKADTYIRILAGRSADLTELDTLEKAAVALLEQSYHVESENRIQEKITNDYMIFGYMMILGGLCSILALIGIANVFSNTIGFLRQRKREFARYMSVGMTPESMRIMFCIEALVIAGRPLLITLPLTVASMTFLIKTSYLNPAEFIAEAPVIPIALFSLTIFGFVSLAYYLGGRKILRCDLTDALRDDTME